MQKAQKSEKAPRIIALDLLRGYFLVSIILNHLQWYPNLYDWVALRGTLLVSAAEGFFMVSGMLLGIVRGRNLADKPFRVSALLVLKRGLTLYITSVILMLIFTLIGWFFLDNPGLKPGIRPIDQPIHEILFGAFSLQYLYGWADFLRLYAIFIIATPLALWLLRKGKWWVVAIISCVIWSIFPIAHEITGNSTELLMPLSWQLIFFGGLIIGFHWVDLRNWWQGRTKTLRRSLAASVLGVATLTLAINAFIVIGTTIGFLPEHVASFYHSLQTDFFDKHALDIPRIVLFGLWFTLGLAIFMRYEKQIAKTFGWILLPFGTNSLYVYILHAILLFFAHLVIAPGTTNNLLVNFIGASLILGVILFAVKKRFLFKIIPR